MECARVFLLLLVYVLNNYTASVSTRRLQWAIDDEGCRTPDSGVGACIKITDCKILFDYIAQNNDISDTISSEIKEYACGYEEEMVKVCCPSKLPPHWSTDGDDSLHRNIKLLPSRSECGSVNTINRIINGNVTDLFEFPWAAVLRYQRNINPFSCGASLISKRYVLTAAHCIRSKYKLIGVRLGEYNFTTEIDCIWYQSSGENEQLCSPPHQDFDISVADAIVHEGYDANTLVNDIALIRLPRDAEINGENVYPICLPLTTEEKSTIPTNFTVIGWGATETGFASKVLLKVIVPSVEIPKCAPLYAARTQITDNQLCAGGINEQDSCAGDSGGPLSNDIKTPNGPLTAQYGIVSFGPRICGRERFPAVYTRVSKYISWILDKMRE